MLATDNWCIKVEDRIYGPYTQDQMGNFASEGRLSKRSMVAPAGGKIWREARHFPHLVQLLDGNAKSDRQFGKASGRGDSNTVPGEGEIANFLVIFDVITGTASRAEATLREMGPCFRITDNVWVLSTAQTASGIKNAIAPNIDIRESVFVVDCSRGRTAWANFVPELQSRLMKAWVRA